MADNIRATPRNPVLGLFSDITQGGLDYLRDPRFRQAMMQLPAPVRPFGMGAVALPGLFESTGFPKTLERAAYGEPLTNIGMANVPTLKPETADLLMNVAPFAPAALRGAAATGRFVAPKAGQLAEGYMQRMGMMPGIVPAEGGLLTPSVKPQAPVSQLGFYSAAEQAALNLQRNKGTGQSFINDLMKAPDVKKEELAWTGLDEFLANKPNVTKQEVQDFLAGNRVDLQEVRMGEAFTEDPVGIAKRKEIFDKYEPEIQQLYSELDNVTAQKRNALKLANAKYDEMLYQLNKDEYMPTAQDYEAFNLAEKEVRQANRMQNDDIDIRNRLGKIQNMRDAEANAAYVVPEPIPTKYERYQLPGGENYREILLKLPFKEPPMPRGYGVSSVQYEDGTRKYFAETPTSRSQGFKTQEEAQAELSKTASNLKGFRENLESYRSSHFNEPNILAHMRVNDRVDADGKKMLLIEEIQSDWHQAGREKGYISNYAKQDVKPYTTEQAKAEFGPANADLFWYFDVPGNKLQIPKSRFGTQDEAMNYVMTEKKVNPEGVPDAPFKDTWHQLALKRALKYAADNGYDRVGLTTGAQQAKRYDLSKQVDEIAVPMVNADGSRSVRIDPTDGTSIKLMVDSNGVVTGYGSGSTQFSGKKLDEVLGKEIADKVMNAQASAKFSGLDLQVGGEGMKKYYDEIYPAFLAKQGKKFNAKTGETRIKTGQGIPGGAPVRYIDISPEMKSGVSKGQPMFAAAPIAGVGLGAGQQQQPADILTNELDYPSNPMYTDPLGYSIR